MRIFTLLLSLLFMAAANALPPPPPPTKEIRKATLDLKVEAFGGSIKGLVTVCELSAQVPVFVSAQRAESPTYLESVVEGCSMPVAGQVMPLKINAIMNVDPATAQKSAGIIIVLMHPKSFSHCEQEGPPNGCGAPRYASSEGTATARGPNIRVLDVLVVPEWRGETDKRFGKPIKLRATAVFTDAEE